MPRFENGFIKWYRAAYFSDIGSNIYCLGLWVALLSMANWRNSEIIWKGERRTLPPGTVVTALRELAPRLRCSKDTLRHWLDYLRRTNRISLEHSTRGTLITVLNWHTYQSQPEEAQTQTSHKLDADQTLPVQALARPLPLIEEVRKGRRNTCCSYDQKFEQIYSQFPRKEGKRAGFSIYQRTIKSEADEQRLLKAIQNYSEQKRLTGEIVAHFSTFMGQWEDWVTFQPVIAHASEINTTPLDLEKT